MFFFSLQVLYNNKGYHSMPTYLNVLNNAILRANLPKSKGNPAAYGETGWISFSYRHQFSGIVFNFAKIFDCFICKCISLYAIMIVLSQALQWPIIPWTGPVPVFLWIICKFELSLYFSFLISHLLIFHSPFFRLQGTDVVIAIFIIVAMSFVPASFVVFLVAEKSTKAKHLQFVSGCDPVIYWLANYIWDMVRSNFGSFPNPSEVFAVYGLLLETP